MLNEWSLVTGSPFFFSELTQSRLSAELIITTGRHQAVMDYPKQHQQQQVTYAVPVSGAQQQGSVAYAQQMPQGGVAMATAVPMQQQGYQQQGNG